jgi:hypothetical protein
MAVGIAAAAVFLAVALLVGVSPVSVVSGVAGATIPATLIYVVVTADESASESDRESSR